MATFVVGLLCTEDEEILVTGEKVGYPLTLGDGEGGLARAQQPLHLLLLLA